MEFVQISKYRIMVPGHCPVGTQKESIIQQLAFQLNQSLQKSALVFLFLFLVEDNLDGFVKNIFNSLQVNCFIPNPPPFESKLSIPNMPRTPFLSHIPALLREQLEICSFWSTLPTTPRCPSDRSGQKC